MALRNIVTKEQDVLYKKCRTVEKFDERLWTLLDDMKETLEKSGGVGVNPRYICESNQIAG